MAKSAAVRNRSLHRWGALTIAVPFLVIICTGILLQFKKKSDWIQPPEQSGVGGNPTLPFSRIMEIVRAVPEVEIKSWDDVDRLDVRPGQGVVKVRSKNHWEIQLDTRTGKILQTAYRRSGIIEHIHDGAWFHPAVKWGIFVPTAFVLLGLWGTGLYLFVLPYRVRRRNRVVGGRQEKRRIGRDPKAEHPSEKSPIELDRAGG